MRPGKQQGLDWVILGWFMAIGLIGAGADAGAQPPGGQTVLDQLRQASLANDAEAVLVTADRLLAAAPGAADARVARLLGGRAAWQLGRTDEALRLLAPAVLAWPHDSDWADGTEIFVRALSRRQFNFRAAQWAIALAEISPARAARLVAELDPGALSIAELHYLAWHASTSRARTCAVLTELARRAPAGSALAGELVSAALERCGGESSDTTELRALAPGARPAPLGFYDIAVVGPLNGRYARFGESLAQGAVLAVEEANVGAPFPIRLQLLDSRGDPLTAARVAAAAARRGVGALLGDLLTPATIALGGVAVAGGMPLLSPAATRTDIGTIGGSVFQTIVPREIQAEALARAVVDRLGSLRLAILHPETATGEELAIRFSRTATRLGAEIVAMTPYPEGQTNFALELEPLADLLPEAIFIPGSTRELMAAVPQLSYYEVDTQILALEELGLTEVLQATSEYLQGAIFTDNFYRVPEGRLAAFAARYEARYHRAPDSFATRGYVAMGVLVGAMQSGARNRAELALALERRVIRFTPDDTRGILRLNASEGQVALFRADGTRVTPLD